MEIVRCKDAEGNEQCVIRCEIHNYYFNARPPLVSGCSSCWMAYYVGQNAMVKGDKGDAIDQLEMAIRHMADEIDAGTWDFEPDLHPNIKIETEN